MYVTYACCIIVSDNYTTDVCLKQGQTLVVQVIFETLCECAALNPDSEEGMHSNSACTCSLAHDFLLKLHPYAAVGPNMWTNADDSEDEGFYYNEEEALNGIGADGRAAMLDHLDSLLDDTDAHDLDEVSTALHGAWQQSTLIPANHCSSVSSALNG